MNTKNSVKDWLHYSESPSFIAEGTRVRGDLEFISETQIHGIVEGNIRHLGTESLKIGEQGWIHGSIVTEGPLVISGRVDGNIFSSCSIELTSQATVSGQISSKALKVAPGALLEAQFDMKRA